MASAFGHVIASVGVGKLFPKKIMSPKVFILGAVSSVWPDLDVIVYNFGFFETNMWTHRGITHSFFVAVLWALVLLSIYHWAQSQKEKLFLGIYYFLATASHGILDSLTTGGDGICFFAPFSEERFFLPYRVIMVSPIGISNFFSEWGWQVIQSEFIFIALPSLVLAIIGYWLNKLVYK